MQIVCFVILAEINSTVALLYVDEAKGIEFDTVFVVDEGMDNNEKYVAYSRAITRLFIFR